MATNSEIRAWAQEQGFQVGEKGRISNTIKLAYEAATGDEVEIVDVSPEPPGEVTPGPSPAGSPFVPGDAKDPKPARTRQPKSRAGKPTSAQVLGDIQGKTALLLTFPAVAWQARDPYCGAVAVQQVPEISAALAGIFAQSPEIVEWFTGGKGGNFMAWVNLAAACQPVLTTVLGHHVTHTIGQPDAGRFAVPDDQYAA